jgi:hypothetical protein
MERKSVLPVLFILLASYFSSCTHERHHRNGNNKYRVIKEDSTQKVDIDDHMRDYQPH